MDSQSNKSGLNSYSLTDALLNRRSKRFAKGMSMDQGPLAHSSTQTPEPLTIDEEASLAFAACGTTGYAYADLPYQGDPEEEEGGGNIMTNFIGRTIASGDNIHSVAVFVMNDDGAWLVRRPQDFSATQNADFISMGRDRQFTEWYRNSRVPIADTRPKIPREIPYVPAFNKWSAERPGTTTFLPVMELSALYINVMLSAFSEEFAGYILDDRKCLRSAGLTKFAKSKGGFLHDNPNDDRLATVSFIENWVTEFAAIEQGGVHQNLGLMSAALDIGGFPYFAAHPYIWFQALGFRMEEIGVSKIIGAGAVFSLLLKLLNKNVKLPYAVGLEYGGETHLKPFCPPYYTSMEEAVRAFVHYKFDEDTGTLRANASVTGWKNPEKVLSRIPRYSERTIQATIAYCEYIYDTYGRFPSPSGPFRSTVAFQAHHPDREFYDKYYS